MATATFSYTGSLQNWTVPASITRVEFKIWGAGGGAGTDGGWGYGSPGGPGGFTFATLDAAVPGTVYYIVVGQGGAQNGGGTYGGGAAATGNNSDNRYSGAGGGYSGIFTSNTITQGNALLIAGAGGGGGSSRASGPGNAGGGGGGLVGVDGSSTFNSKFGYRGRGGTQSAAGANASSDSPNVTPAQGALQGGTTRTNSYGGGGGGGYYGGSGGGYSEGLTMAGGAGGSGFITTGVTFLISSTVGSSIGTYTPPRYSADPNYPISIDPPIGSGGGFFSGTGGNGYVAINY